MQNRSKTEPFYALFDEKMFWVCRKTEISNFYPKSVRLGKYAWGELRLEQIFYIETK
jgi:hypothetical protein